MLSRTREFFSERWTDLSTLQDLQPSEGNSQFTGINFSLKLHPQTRISLVLNRFYSFAEQRAKNCQILATRALCWLGLRVILRSLGSTFVSKKINLNRVSVSTGCWRDHGTLTTSLLFHSHQSNLAFFSFFVSLQDREMIIWPYLWETEGQPWAWRWLKED